MIRIYVGCAAKHEDLESQAVLEWSLRKHTQSELDITWMYLSDDPDSPFFSRPSQLQGWNTTRWATPFSGFRWAVPHLAQTGKAIYCDSDFIFLDDVAKLYEQDIPAPAVVLSRTDWRLCCSLWDCERARKVVPSLQQLQQRPDIHGILCSQFQGSSKVRPFKGDWNNLDGKDGRPLDKISALHYTDMRCQPQLRYANARLAAQGRRHWFDGKTFDHPRRDVQELFDQLLVEATENGYGPERYAEQPVFTPPYKKRSFERRY